MSETTIVPARLTLSQINGSKSYNIPSGLVMPTDDPNDIYKLFPEHSVIYMAVDVDSNYGNNWHNRYTYSPKFRISFYASAKDREEDNYVKHYANQQVNIIIDYKPNFIHTDNYYKKFLIDNICVDFSDWKYKQKRTIVENNGVLFLKYFDWLWTIEKEAKNNIGNGAITGIKVLNFIQGLNVDNMNDDYRIKIINQLLTKASLVLPPMPGVTKTVKQVQAFYDKTIEKCDENILRITAFTELYRMCHKVVNSIKVSVIFNNLFGGVTTQEQFDAVCDNIKKYLFDEKTDSYSFNHYFDRLTQGIDSAKELRKDSLKRKATGSFNKIMQDVDFITISDKTHPLTYDAIHSGELPTGIFFRKTGDSYFIYNDNWDVWEEALASDYVEEVKTIAKAASGRSTFEKDIMSYLNFTYVTLPEYLERNTGKKWRGIPKFVNSTESIEPPKEVSGTIKTRSALTPIVDNENNTVTVPYAAIVSSGSYGSTYCYALDYNVLARNYTLDGNVITREVEKALNGRDDYGLMFYTLTGSTQTQGYPTFLIIFERLDDKTTVHFHRTHPMRSKDGEPNPINNWIRGCYKWMIGNVNFEKIAAQQGDLAFVSIDKFPDGEPTKVNQYDSHCFEHDVDYLPYTKKDRANVLGYVNLPTDTKLNHTHHRQRVIPAGVYEIRQCRSWEANPTGIWSLRID